MESPTGSNEFDHVNNGLRPTLPDRPTNIFPPLLIHPPEVESRFTCVNAVKLYGDY